MSKLNSYFKVNDNPCLDDVGHIWSGRGANQVQLCLKCYQPKLIVR